MIAGTDPALYLGMISLILDKGWYNAPYLKAYTSMPFMVKRSDGSLLRKDPVDDIKQAGSENPFLVWDENASGLSPYDADGISPALDFETTIDGEAYATVFKLLKETQKQYSLSWAAEMTGIDEDVLRSFDSLVRLWRWREVLQRGCRWSCGGIAGYARRFVRN